MSDVLPLLLQIIGVDRQLMYITNKPIRQRGCLDIISLFSRKDHCCRRKKNQKTHSSVVGVPEGSGGEVEAHGEGEGGNEGGGDEDRVSSEEGVVDDLFE